MVMDTIGDCGGGAAQAQALERRREAVVLRGGRSAAIVYTLIETAKLNGIDPHKITRLDELMPWSYAAKAA
jgi:hypothetical protein